VGGRKKAFVPGQQQSAVFETTGLRPEAESQLIGARDQLAPSAWGSVAGPQTSSDATSQH